LRNSVGISRSRLLEYEFAAVTGRAYARKNGEEICGGQPSTSVVEHGPTASAIKAGLWPPPSAAEDLDGACRPSFATKSSTARCGSHRRNRRKCRAIFSPRRLCAGPDSHQQQRHFGKGKVEARGAIGETFGIMTSDFSVLISPVQLGIGSNIRATNKTATRCAILLPHFWLLGSFSHPSRLGPISFVVDNSIHCHNFLPTCAVRQVTVGAL
jgi:hypothetical protein